MPTAPQALAAAAAITTRALIEVLPLTGLPSQLAQSWPPVRLLLGTTFGMADLIAYAAACTFAYAVDRTLSNRH
jgi:hypothetical protein